MRSRILRRTVVASAVILFIAGVSSAAFFAVRQKPLCTDKIQNGHEEGVDCGLLACGVECLPSAQPITVLRSRVFLVGAGESDVLFQVNNPNTLYTASPFSYDVILRAPDGGEIGRKHGQSFVLPGQTRYLVEAMSVPTVPASGLTAELEVTDAGWKPVSAANIDVNFVLTRQSPVTDIGSSLSKLSGTIFNNSTFNFAKVDIAVVVFGADGDIIGANRTDVRTFNARTAREFVVTWPVNLFPVASRSDIEITTDIFDSGNFVKQYGTQQKFQQY